LSHGPRLLGEGPKTIHSFHRDEREPTSSRTERRSPLSLAMKRPPNAKTLVTRVGRTPGQDPHARNIIEPAIYLVCSFCLFTSSFGPLTTLKNNVEQLFETLRLLHFRRYLRNFVKPSATEHSRRYSLGSDHASHGRHQSIFYVIQDLHNSHDFALLRWNSGDAQQRPVSLHDCEECHAPLDLTG
jgi:hypothetical protein